MKEKIAAKLLEIEKKENVRILLAVESGSRAWGFESPDSDYDVRFIYVRTEQDYLRLDPLRDVIEWQLDDVYDINGWDIRKALRLMRDSNPTLFEWLNSPICYRTSPEAQALAALSAECFSARKAAHHYVSMAKSSASSILGKKNVKLKKYLYALRPILAAQWVINKSAPPPVLFSELENALLPDLLRDETDTLLARKAQTSELGTTTGIPLLNGYIESSLDRLSRCAEDVPKSPKMQWDRLNEYFISTLSRKER